ncbi:3-dehydroquinate synthase II [Candidatus Peregrinibacteria bacterium]|jgi:3-dehydroquinate synthase II|nr:3-dehydroquinate synthase II [Candidatus Peregrinibacteria bacterium]
MKKTFWVKVLNADKKLVTTAIEAGADAVLTEKGNSGKIRKLGIIKTIAEDGDIVLGKDTQIIKITSKEKEDEVVKYQGKIPVIIENNDWEIIPLENLISKTTNLIQSVRSSDQAILALQTMEKGSDGILLETSDMSEIKKTGAFIHKMNQPNIQLEKVKITSIKQTDLCDRCCLDTGNILEPGRGMLIGNSSSAFFLVHNENVKSPYCDPRPFRVNAGAVHAYILLPENKTKYIGELKSGDSVLTVNEKGETKAAVLGRNKIEVRPMLEIEAESNDGKKVGLLMQNAETIRLTSPKGKPISVTHMKAGDEVLGFFQEGGRHFGQAVKESISEQ